MMVRSGARHWLSSDVCRLSVCLSVTSRYCIETAGRIEVETLTCKKTKERQRRSAPLKLRPYGAIQIRLLLSLLLLLFEYASC